MAEVEERYTQFICDTPNHCECADDGDDDVECCCVIGDANVCDSCLARMVEIDFETGERVR